MSGEFADAGSIKASIDFDAAGLQAGIEKAMRAAMPVVSDEIDKVGDRIESSLTDRFKSARNTLLGALGIGGIIESTVQLGGYVASVGRDTERALNMFRAVSGATADEMDQVSEKAQALGADAALAGVSAGDAALAMTELAKSGFSVEEAMAGSTGVLQLATAAQTDAANAATIAASQIQAFGLEAKDSAMVADVLANAANITAADMNGMADSLNQVGAVAKASGLSFAETAGTVALMADNAIIGSDAGTSLKSMLLAIQAPSKQAADVMSELGINMYDNNGQMLSLADMTAELIEGTKGLTDQQRQQALATIFGADAIRTVNVLMNEGAQSVADLTSAVQEQGAAAELADANTRGFTGAIDALRNVADGLAGDIYQNVSPALEDGLRAVLEDLPQTINEGKAYVSEFLDALEPAGRIVASLLEAMTPGVILAFKAALGAALGVVEALGLILTPVAAALEANEGALKGVATAVTAVVLGYKLMTTAVTNVNRVMASPQMVAAKTRVDGLRTSLRSATTAATALRVTGAGMMAAMGGPWGLALAGATVALGAWAGKQAEAKAQVDAHSEALDKQTGALTDANRELIVQQLISKGFDDSALAKYGVTAGEVAEAVLQGGDAIERMSDRMHDAEGFFDISNDAANVTGIMEEQAAALDDAGRAWSTTARAQAEAEGKIVSGADALKYLLTGTGATTEATDDLARGFHDQADAADTARRAVWALQNQFINGMSKQVEYEAAIDDLAATIKDVGDKALTAGGKLAIGGAKGRQLFQALAAVATSAKGAKGGINEARKAMIAILTPLTGSKDRARALTDQFFRLQGGANRAGGAMRGAGNDAKGASGKIDGLKAAADRADGMSVTIPVSVPGLSSAIANANTLIGKLHTISGGVRTSSNPLVVPGLKRASGGPIFGGGTGTSDDVPVLASDGEHMWTAAEVQAAGGHAAVAALRAAVRTGGISAVAGDGATHDGSPLVGSLAVTVGSKDDLSDGLNETLFHLRRIRRGSGRR